MLVAAVCDIFGIRWSIEELGWRKPHQPRSSISIWLQHESKCIRSMKSQSAQLSLDAIHADEGETSYAHCTNIEHQAMQCRKELKFSRKKKRKIFLTRMKLLRRDFSQNFQ